MSSLFFHPMVVHLPIALGILMPFVAAGVLVAMWKNWLPTRAWLGVVLLQALLVGTGIIAMRSGEAEEERVERVTGEPAIEAHEEAAEQFVWASGAVLGVMLVAGALRRSRSGLPLAGAAALGTLLVLGFGYRTGKAGGALVYEHGAAQAYAHAAADGARASGDGDDDHD
ncbi:MAG: hypothetical protein IT381_08620 [Deltaproteobacteria bacterium]|nr:hypothetical protein [Deltaproteobacteria bacterium]